MTESNVVSRVPAPTHEVETLTKQFDKYEFSRTSSLSLRLELILYISGNYDLSSVQSPYTTSHLIKKVFKKLLPFHH